jgi:hypothetical protein
MTALRPDRLAGRKVQNVRLRAALEQQRATGDRLQSMAAASAAVIGNAIGATIRGKAFEHASHRTRTGAYRMHGRTYKTRKLARLAWYRDMAAGRRGSLVEQVLVGAADLAPFLVPEVLGKTGGAP